MTPHSHRTLVEGCYRCELGEDEVKANLQQAAEDLKSQGFRIVKLEHSGWRTADNNPMWVITEEL